MHIEGFSLEHYPPYNPQAKAIDFVSLEDQIAFMAKFYPPSSFRKFTLPQTSASNSKASSSQESLSELSESVEHSEIEVASQKHAERIKEHEMSEIKALKKVLVSESKRFKQRDIKSYNQSQFEYRQLLDELTLNEKDGKAAFSSQKYRNQTYHFELSSEGQKSFVSDQQLDCSYQLEAGSQCHIQKKSISEELIVKKSFKWDPPSEILFRKQNRLHKIFWILSKRIENIYTQFMNKLLEIQNYQKLYLFCITCQARFIKKSKKKECQYCRENKKKV